MIVLASASPRRRDLLTSAGLRFTVAVSDVDESLAPGIDAVSGARALAERKARAVAEVHPGNSRAWIVAADTIVALPTPEATRLLGKPEGPGEARAMLEGLSGSTHEVVTGVCVLAPGSRTCRVDSETTRVTMRPIAPAEVEAYVASGEWRDKAGGYAIQENADAFVTSLEGGGFDNVVGLPVALTLELLRACGEPQAQLLARPGGGPP